MKLPPVYIAVATALLVQGAVSSTISPKKEHLKAMLQKEILTWMASNLKTESLGIRYAESGISGIMRDISSNSNIGTKSSTVCSLCNLVVTLLKTYYKNGMSEEEIQNVITEFCVTLEIEAQEVCAGVINLNAPIVFYIINHKPTLTGETICGLILQAQSCPLADEEFEWTVEIDDGEPKYISSEEAGETLKVIQITDVHYDPEYEVYGNPNCDAPTCCRKGQNDTNTSGEVAGYWGDYNSCDVPWHAIENAIDQIESKEQDIMQVYFTGDIIDHGVWETSRSLIRESINKTLTKLHETFGDVPVYAILGNHESNPMNVFAPPAITEEEISTTWLYEYVADIWISYGWLPESTRSTILKGGFYTVSPRKGFRIIAMNNNVCYVYNWWLLLEPQDPSGQLKWLAETLLQAETDGEYVHILAHMPPGASSCQWTWGTEYRKIVNRFAHIITAEFNGHTHNDEIRVLYDLKNSTEAIRVAWNGGGLNAYDEVNLNYKVYSVDANTYLVENVDTWIYNLTLANETPNQSPAWYKSYSFKEQYGLEDLSISSLNELVIRMAHDSSILETYYGHYVKQTDSKLASGCDENCRADQLCRIVTAVKDDSTQCTYFSNLA